MKILRESIVIKRKFTKNIKFLKKYKTILGYGAPAKATTLLNFFGIKDDLIKNIVDDNNLKINKIIPGTNIKIISSKSTKKKQKCVLVLAWNMFKEIKQKNKNLSNNFFSIRDLFDAKFIKKFKLNKFN